MPYRCSTPTGMEDPTLRFAAGHHDRRPPVRRRGMTIGEPRDLHRIDHGSQYRGPPFIDGRPTRLQRSYTDAEAHPRPRRREQHQQPKLQPAEKMGLRQKLKAAKDVIKDTLQLGRETVGFIRELHKEYKELYDREQENNLRIRGNAGRGVRRRKSYYDS